MNKLVSGSVKAGSVVIKKALEQKRYELLEPEAKELIKNFGIPVGRNAVVSSVDDAVQAARSLGYPVVLKVVSPDISHKTDVGGVKVGIKDDEGVRTAYGEIIKNVGKRQPDARREGIFVEEMATPSREVIVGGLRDIQFGPVVMFGLGGIFVEVFKDVAFRIAPVEEFEALDMVCEVKGSKILKGYRNTEPLDVSALVRIIMKVSDMMVSLDEIKEIDLNPVLVYPEGLRAVDARVILGRL